MAKLIDEKLKAALENKNNDVKSFIWKGEKQKVNDELVQTEKRMVDCTEEELVKFYNYCNQMLYNSGKTKPGRYVLLDIIKDQRKRCNAELFLRWVNSEKKISRPKFRETLAAFIQENKDVDGFNPNTFPISGAISNIPIEFSDIPLNLIMEGCIDTLGVFNKQHITKPFIFKQGLWFTPEESKDLTEKDENGNLRDKLEVVKERLGINPKSVGYQNSDTKRNYTYHLRITSKGLSYTQLRAMMTLKSKKYSDLATSQLTTLRDRILFALEDEVKFHISQWEGRMKQIQLVCKYKGYNDPASLPTVS